jgi:hypothetical protein
MNIRRFLIPALCVALILAAVGVLGFLFWHGDAARTSAGSAPALPPQTVPDAGATASPGDLFSPAPMPDVEAIIRQSIATGAERGRRTSAATAEAQRRFSEDPKAALAWATGLPEEERTGAVEVVVSLWAALDPAAAFEAALFLDEKNAALRTKALTTVLTQWARKDAAAAWKSVQTLPSDSKDRAFIEMQIAMEWAGKDPVAASRALQQGADLTGFHAELAPAFGTVANELARKDLAAAKTWAAGLPQGPAQSSAVSAVIATLAQQDVRAAAASMDELGPGPARDAGVMVLVSSGVPVEPAVGMRWAETVAKPALRETLVSQFALRWLAAEPAQAKAWMADTAVLTEKQKQELLALSEKLPPIPDVSTKAQAR